MYLNCKYRYYVHEYTFGLTACMNVVQLFYVSWSLYKCGPHNRDASTEPYLHGFVAVITHVLSWYCLSCSGSLLPSTSR